MEIEQMKRAISAKEVQRLRCGEARARGGGALSDWLGVRDV